LQPEENKKANKQKESV